MIALVDDFDTPIATLVRHGSYQYPETFNATLTHRRFLCYPSAAYRTPLLADGSGAFFTTPHFDGYPAILVRLHEITVEHLDEVVTEG
jgi:hypothetical protein